MSEHPALWIVLIALISAGLVWIQYFYRRQTMPYRWPLAALRYLAIFGILLLLVNPQVRQRETFVEKHSLTFLLDNSSSIALKEAGESLREVRGELSGDPEMQERFQFQTYTFGNSLLRSDRPEFNASATDIAGALEEMGRILPDRAASVVLITDGNENTGRSVTSLGETPFTVYPVVVGDTTRFTDLRIDGINMNRFAFLGNRYPIEVLASYNGDDALRTELRISDNGRPVYRETLEFKAGGDARRLEIYLDAKEVGLHTVEAFLTPAEGERNRTNNRRISGLEVVDESTDVRIVTRTTHPDLAALQRSILQNQQRECRIESPQEALRDLESADLLVLYQPDASFRELFAELSLRSTPRITIAGPRTDWNFLNNAQSHFELEDQGPPEALLPEANPGFAYYDTGSWDVGRYPPLDGDLGSYRIIPEHQILLEQRVKGISLGEPLWALIKGSYREAVIFGNGIWKWRISEFRSNGDFSGFDQAVSKMLLFLTAGEGGKRLTLDYERVYEGVENAVIRARFVDESYQFDPNARLLIQFRDSLGQNLANRPMSLRGRFFETFVGDLPPGPYSFTVAVEGTEFRQSGQISLQAFDLEAQQVSSNPGALSALAQSSGGQLYFPETVATLKDTLLQSDRFRPIQKSRLNVVSLIDFRWLLALIVTAFAAEWFLRKYNGLI